MPGEPARDRGRMARTTTTIVLELDQTTDCPSGSARLTDGTSRDFHGWLGLAEAIDVLAQTPVGATPTGVNPAEAGEEPVEADPTDTSASPRAQVAERLAQRTQAKTACRKGATT